MTYGSVWSANTSRGRPGEDFPDPITSATSMSPSCSRNQASDSAHAPSISTWLSYTGGHAPTPSMFMTNANGIPER